MKVKKILVGSALALTLVGLGVSKASAVWVGDVPLRDKVTGSGKLVSRTYKTLRVTNGYRQHQTAYYQIGNYYYSDYWYDTY